MRLLGHFGAGVLLLAAALLPRPGNAADATHPLDPGAAAGSIPTQNAFGGYIPLLDRDEPVPSFAADQARASGSAEAESAPAAMPMDHGTMDHGAMGHGNPAPGE